MISTHTLTWSVTRVLNNFIIKSYISTHTLTWSVTFIGSYSGFKLTISTHTLTWSVTNGKYGLCRYGVFQLTRSRGA